MGLEHDTRVLLTGATGLIGRQVRRLLEEQVELYVVSRNPPATGAARWLAFDLSLPGAAAELVWKHRPEVIIHLAGAVRGDRSLDAIQPTLGANLLATVELLEAATRAGVRRIVTSGSLLEEPASGGSMVTPPSPYGASRWASSAYARMFHALFATPVVILRPSYAYGPGQDETKLFPHVITNALQGERALLASGERRLDFVYSEDVGRAYVAAATAVGVEGETIDIGSGELVRVRDAIDAMLDLLENAPRPDFSSERGRPFEQELRVDTGVAERLLGWHASTSLTEGLRRTVDWYARRGAE